MKPILITLTAALLATTALHAQDPIPTATPSPTAAATASVAPALTTIPVVTAPLAPAPPPPPPAASVPAQSGTFSFDTDLDAKLDKIGKGMMFKFDSDKSDNGNEALAIPIVFIVFASIFGCPVLIVAVILFANFWKTRSLHRTVRLMVEKGVEVPPALLTPPDRPRSDSRRGVILTMTGLGLILFFAARHGAQGGSWSIGVIPFMIGLGYLLVARLDRPKAKQLPPA